MVATVAPTASRKGVLNRRTSLYSVHLSSVRLLTLKRGVGRGCWKRAEVPRSAHVIGPRVPERAMERVLTAFHVLPAVPAQDASDQSVVLDRVRVHAECLRGTAQRPVRMSNRPGEHVE